MTSPPPSPLPEELRGWNWGAFLLNWVWGLGNSTYIAFLVFIPVVNLVMPFVLGAKGNEWAWRNDDWRDIAHFKRVQRNWAWAGLVSYVCIASFVALLLFGVATAFRSSLPYNMSMDMVRDDIRVERILGTPISETGWMPLGTINIANGSGEAAISYDISGPGGDARVHVSAQCERGVWTITGLVVTTPGETINIID